MMVRSIVGDHHVCTDAIQRCLDAQGFVGHLAIRRLCAQAVVVCMVFMERNRSAAISSFLLWHYPIAGVQVSWQWLRQPAGRSLSERNNAATDQCCQCYGHRNAESENADQDDVVPVYGVSGLRLILCIASRCKLHHLINSDTMLFISAAHFLEAGLRCRRGRPPGCSAENCWSASL